MHAFLQYLQDQGVGAVILPAPAPAAWDALLRSLGGELTQVEGMAVYRSGPDGWTDPALQGSASQ